MHLFGFIIRMYRDARAPERQITVTVLSFHILLIFPFSRPQAKKKNENGEIL